MIILSINMWLLPFGFSKDNKKRINLLIKIVNKYNPDLIALQEIWQNRYINYLNKYLKNYYFCYHKTKFWNNSGLLTLSKIKPKKIEFYPFVKKKDKGFLNKFLLRGFLKISFNNFDFFNTHLYHRTDYNNGLEIAFEEFTFLKKKINRFSILCGDLNIDKKIFEKFNDIFYYLDNEKNTFSSRNKYSKKFWENKVILDKKIDYILSTKKLTFSSKLIKGISDHYGLISFVNL